jgi:DNA-binding response OmpR family regulator
MKVLIYDERSDTLEFFLESVASFGYKVGIAKDGSEIINMLSNDQYDVVLSNYKEFDAHQYGRLKSSSTFIIGITDSRNQNKNMDSKADLYLQRPFGASNFRHAVTTPFNH